MIFVGPMSLSTVLADRAAHIQTDQFRQLACTPEHPMAFQRRRKLPLPALIALMLTGMRKSVQTELDEFFGHLQQQAQPGSSLQRRSPAARSGLSLPMAACRPESAWHPFCMRVEQSSNSGFACVRQFLRSGLDEQID
ncbi:hypothetical protein OKW43_006435 [Paraburkholderia sp. WC7.3g]|uniref:hypothetical protein n=1 Tax=Paraburkholderia sp. WC7.3g TaxID=2991070 RepID=UPI003D191CDB